MAEELNETIYQAIENARNGGKIKKGINEVTKSIEKGTAKLVAYAGDVNPPEIVMHLPLLCKEKDIPCAKVGGRAELGAAAGLKVSTVAIAIVNEGNAKDLVKQAIGQLQE